MRTITWRKYECRTSGARFTSVRPLSAEDMVCGFSGCDCGKRYSDRGETADRNEAYNWFRRANAQSEAAAS